MHPLVSFNNKILPVENAAITAASVAALYGKGIFTTIAVRAKKLFLWEKHWRRLNENAEKLSLDLTNFTEKAIQNAFDELIEANKLTDGRARISFFDEGAGSVWNFGDGKKTSFLMTTAEPRSAPVNLRLTVSPFRVNSGSPLAGVKSCNYLEKILAFDQAKKRGFDEAVQLNERGTIASACLANIFWLAAGKIHTPPLTAGCLAGTTRESLIEKLKFAGKYECVETETDLRSLGEADAIFLTSANLSIVPVAEFNGRIYECDQADIKEITELI